MACLLNFPGLIDKYESIFGGYVLSNSECEGLRQEMMIVHLAYLNIGQSELLERLRANGFAGAIEKVLSRRTYVHAAFAKPTQNEEVARLGLEDIWAQIYREAIAQEVKRASENLMQHPTPHHQRILDSYQEILESLKEKESQALIKDLVDLLADSRARSSSAVH